MILKNKKVLVVGLGKSGLAAVKFLLKKGAKVSATDSSDKKQVLENAAILQKLGVRVEIGCHSEAFMEKIDLVVTSPGVPKQSLPLAYAKKKKIPVISEIELASFFCLGRVTAVTGSNGKTTTCHLIHRIFEDAARDSILCGNIGVSFLDSLREIGKKSEVVLELSSFQLEDCQSLRPRVSVVLNIARNHMDRHKTLANYAAAKARIFKNQKTEDCVVLNYDDAVVRKMAKKVKARIIFFSTQPLREGVFYDNGKIIVREAGKEKFVMETDRIKLRGRHNLQNILAAVAAANFLKVPAKSLQKSLESFKTLPHRIEPIGKLGGVQFFNDSKSTTVESTRAALLAVPAPVVLLAGGRDKGSHFSELEALLKNRVKYAVLYGEAREKIAASWKSFKKVQLVPSFRDAVRSAYKATQGKDALLLSPMCTSFDQFSSYAERGEAFKQVFLQLSREKKWKS